MSKDDDTAIVLSGRAYPVLELRSRVRHPARPKRGDLRVHAGGLEGSYRFNLFDGQSWRTLRIWRNLRSRPRGMDNLTLLLAKLRTFKGRVAVRCFGGFWLLGADSSKRLKEQMGEA